MFVQEGQRRIPIQYAKRMVGRRMTAGGSTYLPLRVNMAGVIPVIFAAAVLAFPPTMAQYFPATQDFVNTYFQPGDITYLLFEGFMIVVFTFFYTAVQFNPVEQADNLRRHGGYIPGIRPGPPTAQYLDRVLTRLTLPGSLFLAAVAIAPSIFIRYGGFAQANARALGGTSVLIVVGVALDTMRQMESQMMMRSYEGFLQVGARLASPAYRFVMRVLILGVQGSGKGTQAKLVAAELGVEHVATGDILRAAIAEGTELGLRVEPILERGDLVPDDVMVELIREHLATVDGFVLDGFPRTLAQAEALDEMLASIGKPLDVVLLLQVSDTVAIGRVVARAELRGAHRRHAGGDRKPGSALPPAHRAGGRALSVDGHRHHAGRRAARGRGLHPGSCGARRVGSAGMIVRKTPREIEKIGAAGQLVAETIAHVGALVVPGVTTAELDDVAGAFIRERGGVPTSEGYKGYPAAICISQNEVVVHGIPGPYVVAEGDLVTIDVGVTLDGWIADSAYTFGVGVIDSEALFGCSTSARRRSPPESSRRRPGAASATSRARSNRSSRTQGSRSCAASSAMELVAITTRIRSSPISGAPAEGRSSRPG